MSAIARLNAMAESVKAQFIAREEVIDLLKFSVMAQQHMILLGPPGCAKSQAVNYFLARLPGQLASFDLQKGSIPDEVVGPMSMRAYKEQDEIRHNTTGMLPEADFAFIDEVFKGNGFTRNALLRILNERQYKNGSVVMQCPLRMCVAASNEYPDNNDDSAFYDRFLTRYHVDYLATHDERMQMVALSRARRRGAPVQDPAITLEEIDEIHEQVRAVRIPPEVAETADALYRALVDLGPDARISDRRFADSFQLASAVAVAHGRDALIPDDLIVFTHTAWRFPDIRQEVQRAVLRTISPEIADITVMYDEIEDGFAQFLKARAEAQKSHADADTITTMIIQAHTQFVQTAEHNWRKMEDIIIRMQKEQRDTTKARELYGRAKARDAEAKRLAITGEDGD